MSDTCTRLWQVEAARDDRLVGADRASFERHLATCDECRAETRAIEAIADKLRALPAPIPDELATRRRRQQLLADADRAALDPSNDAPPRRSVALLVAALAAVAIAGVGARAYLVRSRPTSAPPSPTSTSTVRELAAVQSSPGAKWSRRMDGAVERIALTDGELAIDVRHATGSEHVLVSLPDGEVEDLGTRFVVAVRGGRASRVVVREGLVVLRLDGHAPVHIAAGSSWSALVEAPSTSACATVSAAEPAPPIHPAAPPPFVASAPKTPTPSAAPDAASPEFQTAMAHLRAGDNATAAAAFAAFVASHPADARTEDAAYLRVVALQRAGHHTAARTAASDYLARFPKGFRRREVEAVAP
jgi:hypothetical protein